MLTTTRSIQQIVEEQVHKWQREQTKEPEAKATINLITVSREPGSGGKLVAQGIADRLEFDLFHQEVIHAMANSANVSARILESLDEKGLNVLEDWIASVVHQKHLWPDEYLQHLLKVIGTIGKHGSAVLVGRGANFILKRNSTLRLRFIAPLQFRAEKVAQEFDIPTGDAHRRILQTESDRRAFIRKYFHQDIDDPRLYDLVLNTDTLSLEECIDSVCGIIHRRNE